MLALVNLLRGYCTVEVRSEYPERFLNICARGGVEFWKTEWIDGGYRVRVRRRAARLMEGIAPRAGCVAEVVSRRGVPFVLGQLCKRWMFVAGAALFVAALLYSSSRVWEIEVVGCETVSVERVLRELEAVGVGMGTRISDIDPDYIGDEMLLRIPELRWFTVNVNGSIATAELRERVEPPEMEEDGAPRNLVAARAGIVEEVVALEGAAVVAAGDTVAAGDLLISGIVDNATGAKLVYARGTVLARSWRVLEASMPLEVELKTYTGVETARYSLIFAGRRINLYFDSSNLPVLCDKIIERTQLAFSDSLRLPVVLEKTVYREYEQSTGALDRERVERELEALLRERLERETGGAEQREVRVEFREEGGMLVGRLTAECIEEITAPVDISTELWEN